MSFKAIAVLNLATALAISPPNSFDYRTNITPAWERLFSTAAGAEVDGNFSKAEDTLKTAATLAGILKDNLHLARASTSLADLYTKLDRYDQAENAFKTAIDAYRSDKNNHDQDLAVEYGKLASLYFERAHYELAEAANDQSLGLCRKVGGSYCLGVGVALYNRGSLEARRGAGEQAEKDFAAAIEVFQKAGAKHTALVGLVSYKLAELYATENKYSEAERYYERALKIIDEQVDNDDITEAVVKKYTAVLRLDHKQAAAAKLESQWGL